MIATWILILTISTASGKVALESMEVHGEDRCLKAGKAWVDLQTLPKSFLAFVCVKK